MTDGRRLILALAFALLVLTAACDQQSPQTSNDATLPSTQRGMAEKDELSFAENKNKEAPIVPEDSEVSAHPLLEPVSGIQIVRRKMKGTRPGYLVIAEIDSTGFDPEIVGVTPAEPDGHSLAGVLYQQEADLVLGSGFLERFYPVTPLGLLVINKQEISGLAEKGFSTLVGIEGNELHIISRDQYRSGRFSGAMQVGPRLLQDGNVVIRPSEPERRAPTTRAFLAICNQNTILAGISEDIIHLYDLAVFLASSTSETRYACREAVNLSGGGAEGLIVRTKGSKEPLAWGNISFRQGSMIAFMKK